MENDTTKTPVGVEPPTTPEPTPEPTAKPAVDEHGANKPDPAKDTTPDKTPDPTVTDADDTWPEYTDTALTGIQGVLKDGGFTSLEANLIFEKALESGKLEDINSEKLIEKLGASKAALVLAGAKDYYDRNMATQQATIQAVHEVFGGEDNFATVKEWVAQHEGNDPIFAEKIDELRGMLNQGGFPATAAAKELLRMHNEDPNTSTPNIKLEQGDTGAKPANTGAMNRKAYLDAITVAYKENDPSTIQALRARRRATILAEANRA